MKKSTLVCITLSGAVNPFQLQEKSLNKLQKNSFAIPKLVQIGNKLMSKQKKTKAMLEMSSNDDQSGCQSDPTGCQAEKEQLLDQLINVEEEIKEKQEEKDHKDDECPFAEAVSDLECEVDNQTQILQDIDNKLSQEIALMNNLTLAIQNIQAPCCSPSAPSEALGVPVPVPVTTVSPSAPPTTPTQSPPTAPPTSAPPTAPPTSAPPTAPPTSAPPTAPPTSAPPTSAPPTAPPTSVPPSNHTVSSAPPTSKKSSPPLTVVSPTPAPVTPTPQVVLTPVAKTSPYASVPLYTGPPAPVSHRHAVVTYVTDTSSSSSSSSSDSSQYTYQTVTVQARLNGTAPAQ